MAKAIYIDGTCAGIEHFARIGGRIPRKLSREEQYQRERDRVLQARMVAEGDEVDLMLMAYGATPLTDDGKLLAAGQRANLQRNSIKHTTKGDFTHLHSGRNELR